MKYLFFDIECCDGVHMCSFGYVIINKNFEILDKKDLVMNPEAKFNLGGYRKNPRIDLAYNEDTFIKQKSFKNFYDKIKELLTAKDTILLGHSIKSDLQYLKIACERYDLPILDLKVYDTQNFYYQLNNKYSSRSLDNIIKDLEIDISDLFEHKSDDDAYMSMLVTEDICKRLNCSIDELLELCDKSLIETNKKIEKSEEAKKRQFSKKLKAIAEKYPKRDNCKSICLSDTIKENDINERLKLIKIIFDSGYNYTCKASICDYFVTGQSYGERDLSCDHNIEDCNKEITKITLKDLSKMLGVEVNEFGEIIEKKIEENNQPTAFQIAYEKALEKKNN